ncbi:hypothetical protein G7046_g9622 [Stylonectria norvegica]|nr:hypothetical protein G7046_g9622 [Stylonectria norvegica]
MKHNVLAVLAALNGVAYAGLLGQKTTEGRTESSNVGHYDYKGSKNTEDAKGRKPLYADVVVHDDEHEGKFNVWEGKKDNKKDHEEDSHEPKAEIVVSKGILLHEDEDKNSNSRVFRRYEKEEKKHVEGGPLHAFTNQENKTPHQKEIEKGQEVKEEELKKVLSYYQSKEFKEKNIKPDTKGQSYRTYSKFKWPSLDDVEKNEDPPKRTMKEVPMPVVEMTNPKERPPRSVEKDQLHKNKARGVFYDLTHNEPFWGGKRMKGVASSTI